MDDTPDCAGCGGTWRVVWSGTWARYLCDNCLDLFVVYTLYPQLLEDRDSARQARKIGVPGA